MATSLIGKIKRASGMKSQPRMMQAAMQQPSTTTMPAGGAGANQQGPKAAVSLRTPPPKQQQPIDAAARPSRWRRGLARRSNSTAPAGAPKAPSIPADVVGAMQASMASKRGPVMTQQQQHEANRKPLTQQQMMAKGGAVKKKKGKK